MKKVICLLLALLMALSLAACGESPASEGASSSGPSPNDVLQVDFDMGYYTSDFPLPLFSPEEREQGIKDWLGAAGFYNMTTREDGYVVFSVKRSDYDAFMAELKQDSVEGIEYHLKPSASYTSVKAVDYNEDLTRVTFTVDREEYEDSLDYGVVSGSYRNAWQYQQFRLDWDGSFIIEVKDAATGEVFESIRYPEDRGRWAY